MKTVQIKGYRPKEWLLKELYKKVLKDDPSWHFVYWEEGWTSRGKVEGKNIILRVSDNKLKDVLSFLNQAEITKPEVYEFPHPKKWWQLGIPKGGWEDKYPNAAIPMLHAIAEANMTMREQTYKKFLAQFMHIGCNTFGFNHADEALFEVAISYGSLRVVKDWYFNIGKELQYAKAGQK